VNGIDEILRNWARWVRVRQRQGRCGSIEHRYKLRRIDDTPYGWDEWLTTAPTVPLPPMDSNAALAVEKVMRYLPEDYRLALRLAYVERFSWRDCCKHLSLAYNLWWSHLSDSQHAVLNLLTRHQAKGTLAAQFEFRYSAPDGATGVCVKATCG